MRQDILEMISGFAFEDSKRVIQGRRDASDQRLDYPTRLHYDQVAARAEGRIIDRARRIEACLR